jgi:hypothetical protein
VTAPVRAPVPENTEAWHALPADEVSRRIHTEPERGLRGVEAARRLLLAGVTLTAFLVGMHWYGTEGEELRRAVTMGF